MNLINFYRTRHLNAHFASLNAHFVEHKNAKATAKSSKTLRSHVAVHSAI